MVMIAMLAVGCGSDGVNGVNGVDGKDGQSCFAETRNGVNYIVCGDDEFEVADGDKGDKGFDGEDGEDGQDGADFDGIIEYVKVCPDKNSGDITNGPEFAETLLYLNGKFMAFLANGSHKKERLVVLPRGNYKTTDGRNQFFRIVEDGLNSDYDEIECF